MKVLSNNSSQNIFWNYLLFLVWPLLGFLVSIKHFYLKSSKVCIVLFYGIFGYTLLFSVAMDPSRYKSEFEGITTKPFSEFFNFVFNLYSSELKPDFFMNLVAFIVSRFSSNYQLYFMVLGVLLGFMVVKNVKFFYVVYLDNKNRLALLFIFFFMILMPPMRILSFRHYFALLVFIYGVYHFFITQNKSYLVLISSVVFIHFGFLMVVPLFYLYWILGNKNRLYYMLIILSFVFFEQAASLIRDSGVDLEGGLDRVVRGYTHEKYLARVSVMQTNRFLIIDKYIRWTTLFFLITMLYHKLKYKVFDVVGERLFSFSLVLFAFVNFMQGMESVSNRFGLLYQTVCCIFYIHVYSKNQIKSSQGFLYVSIVMICINFLVIFRTSMEFANVLLITPISILSFIVKSDMSLLNLIK